MFCMFFILSGLNAGVLILDTKKLAEFGWLIYLQKMADIYSNILPYADQDLIRLTVLFHPGKMQSRLLLDLLLGNGYLLAFQVFRTNYFPYALLI